MSTQQQPVANENLSGIDTVIKSVNTLTEAGFNQDQSLALAKAISGMISAEISACMKPFMDETNRRLKSVERKLDWLQKIMVTFAVTMGGSFVALTALVILGR